MHSPGIIRSQIMTSRECSHIREAGVARPQVNWLRGLSEANAVSLSRTGQSLDSDMSLSCYAGDERVSLSSRCFSDSRLSQLLSPISRLSCPYRMFSCLVRRHTHSATLHPTSNHTSSPTSRYSWLPLLPKRTLSRRRSNSS